MWCVLCGVCCVVCPVCCVLCAVCCMVCAVWCSEYEERLGREPPVFNPATKCHLVTGADFALSFPPRLCLVSRFLIFFSLRNSPISFTISFCSSLHFACRMSASYLFREVPVSLHQVHLELSPGARVRALRVRPTPAPPPSIPPSPLL